MSRFRFVLSSVWFYAVMVIGLFLSCDLGFLTETPLGTMPINSYFLLTGLFCLVLIAYFFAEHKRNKMTVDWVLLPIVLGLMTCNIIAIWHNPEFIIIENPENGSIIEAHIEEIAKIKDTIFTAMTYIFVYVVGFVFSRSKPRSRKLVWLALVIVLINIVFCVVSVFLDSSFFIHLFDGTRVAFSSGCRSIYQNENAFAESLLVGLICAILVIYHKPKWAWAWILLIALYLYLFCTTSTTCILVGTIALGVFCIIQIFAGYYNKHLVTSTIFLVILVGLIFAGILVLAIGTQNEVGPILAIDKFIKDEILSKDFGSFTARRQIWEHSFQLLNRDGFAFWLGYGMNISNDILSAYQASFAPLDFTSFAHNGFVKVLLDGGLITFIAYCLLLAYFVYCIIRLLIKKKFHFSFIYLLLAGTVIFHDFFESSHFFKNYAQSMITTLLVLMPPMIAWKQMRHPKLKQSILASYAIPTQGVTSKHFIAMVSFAIMSLIAAGISAFAGSYLFDNRMIMKYVLLGIAFLGISLIFVPYLSFVWYKKTSDVRFFFRALLNGIIILGAPALTVVLMYFHVTESKKILALVGMGMYAGLLFVDMCIYSLARRCNLLIWIKETFKSIFVYNIGGKIVGLVLSVMTVMLVQIFMELDFMTFIVLIITSAFVFIVAYLAFPSHFKSEMLDDFNEEGMLGMKRLVVEERL